MMKYPPTNKSNQLIGDPKPTKHPNFGGWNSAFAVQLKDGSPGWIWMVFWLWFRPFLVRNVGTNPPLRWKSPRCSFKVVSPCANMNDQVWSKVFQLISTDEQVNDRTPRQSAWNHPWPLVCNLQHWRIYKVSFSKAFEEPIFQHFFFTIYFSMFFQIRIYRSSSAFPCISPGRCGVFFHENFEDPQLAKLEKLKAFSRTSDLALLLVVKWPFKWLLVTSKWGIKLGHALNHLGSFFVTGNLRIVRLWYRPVACL